MVSTESDAGFTPITASPQPYSSPSKAERRMPPISSAGWLGWTRMPSTPGSPIVFRQRVTLRILAAASTRSLLLMILVDRRGYFRNDGPLKLLQVRFARGVVEDVLAKFADRQALDRPKGFLVEGFENQAADVIFVGIDQRLLDNFGESQIGEFAFGRDAFAFRPRGDPANWSPDFSSLAFAKSSRRSEKANRPGIGSRSNSRHCSNFEC